MKKFIKWGLIVFVGLIILGAIFGKDDKKGTSNSTEQVAVDDIEVVKQSETSTDNMSTVHVEVKNNTEKLLTGGQIKVIYEDAKGNIVGTGLGTILNLASGASKVVDCLAMDVVGATTYKVEVTPLSYE